MMGHLERAPLGRAAGALARRAVGAGAPVRRTIGVAGLIAAIWVAPPAQAQQQERDLGWKNASELGFVLTAGNSDTTSFNARNIFTYDWPDADLDWELGILRASSGDDHFAVGTADDFDIVEPDVEPDNNRISTSLRYVRRLGPRFFWYTRFFYERDEPADVDYRHTPSGGGGTTWIEDESVTFRTGFGIGYTAEKFAFEGAREFTGYQLFYDVNAKPTDTTSVESKLTFDGGFKNGGNFRLDWYNGVGVAITERLALKVSLRLLYRNQPPLEEIDLQDASGTVVGSVVVPKEKLDSSFTTSLVVNF